MRYLKVAKIVKTDSIMVVARGWEEENGDLLFNEYRVFGFTT